MLDYLLTATYADGFVYAQDQTDTSLFEDGRSAYFDIDKELLVPEHGVLTSLACTNSNTGEVFTTDFTQLPANARPVYYRERLLEVGADGTEYRNETAYFFGYQYTDEAGSNQKSIQELP